MIENQSNSSHRSNNKQLEKSQFREENHFYLKISKDDYSSQVLEKDFVPMSGYNYRVVHSFSPQIARAHHSQDLYVDPDFTIDPQQQFPDDDVLVKRLSNLYGITNKPNFIDLKRKPTFSQSNQGVPSCIKELALLDTNHYKGLFMTQDFADSGKYILTVNVEGRYQVMAVDDRVPVYKKTLEPVWGLNYLNPWEMIILKAFAKIKGGYHQVARAKPHEFIQNFSNSTWKYFNLAKESEKFLWHYYENNRYKNGKIILKTKKDQSMLQDGLQPDSSYYQMIAIHERNQKKEDKKQKDSKRFVLTIRTTELVKFDKGELSLYSPQAQNYFIEGMNLDHDMLMTNVQFLKYFSAAHITSTRHQDYFTGYKILDIERYQRKAQHFEFIVPKQGFFDFSINQFQQNKIIPAGQQSKIMMTQNKFSSYKSEISSQTRYLRTKYILVKDNMYDNQRKSQMQNMQTSKIQAIRGEEADFPLPRFTTYQIQYFKGYSKGNAHFVKLDAGRYILRLKSQQVDKSVKYAINWTCSHRIDMKTANITVSEQTDLIHEAMVSIMHKYPHFSFERNKTTEMLTIANSFEDIGYAFASIKSSMNCTKSIIIQVDPNQLDKEGYRLKGKYKVHSDNLKKFSIKVEAGQYDSVVFKKKKDATHFIWPTNAFNIYKKQVR